MPKLIDRTGHVYGRLKVISRFDCGPASKGRRTMWSCLCECGSETVSTGHELASGDTTSCGCFQRESTADRHRLHGMTRTPTYRSWQAAKERCYNPKNDRYSAYGAKGVTVCDRWRGSFDAFLEDMGERPAGLTLDRRNPLGNYDPDNCRWASNSEQVRNKRTSVEWMGEITTITDLALLVGVPRTSLNKLVKMGMPVADAVAQAVATRRS